MSAARKRFRNHKSQKITRLTVKETSLPPKISRRTIGEIAKDVFLGLLVCFLFFFIVEITLRFATGSREDIAEDPFIGFSSIQPLFRVDNGLVTVSPPRLRYFNEISFPVEKPSQTMRIFCFGGSTTYGHPFDHRTSFPRWLQDLLRASVPETKFEVLNVGGISYASYRIVPLVRETLQYSPDLMIIYMGHNEFLERRTYSRLLDQGPTLMAVRNLVGRLRIYQLLDNLLVPFFSARVKNQGTVYNDSGSSKSVLEGEVSALLDRSAGLDLYHRDDDFAEGVVGHFAHNLKTMIHLCRQAGVPVILVDIPSNLKDFSPFKSEHDSGLTLRDQEELDNDIELAAHLISKGEFQGAVSRLDDAIGKDPLFARTYFLKGKALLGMGKSDKARENFIKAKDLDVCPLRCISLIEDQIIKIAGDEKVPLIRFRDLVENRAKDFADGSGIPGNESFLDHVHPIIELHQLLAGMLLDQMVDQRLLKTSRTLSPEDRGAVFAKGMESFDTHFLALRDFNLAKTLKWAGKVGEAREALNRAATKIHDNPEIHKMLGSFHLEEERFDEAIQEYTQAVALSGNDPQMEFDLGVVFYKAGQKEKAVDIYERLLDSEQNMPEVFSNLGMIYLETGKVEKAVHVMATGMQRSPNSPVLFAPYAVALAVSGKTSEAVPWMVKAVQAEPGDPKHLYNLAGMYALTGRVPDAIRTLNLAVDKGYANFGKLSGDRIFNAIRDLPEFKSVLARIEK